MATDFPGAVDTTSKLPNPATGNNTNNPSHAGLHDNTNDAVKATQTKVGTGASVPASGTLLIGTGAGASAWTALTSAQLLALLSDETGTGAAVFANTPVLITPKVDTINENTLNNGVTVGGINLKSGVITTTGYASSTALQANAVQANQLATNAISLASISSSTSQGSITTTAVIVTGLTATVTIPSGGRKVRIEGLVPSMTSTSVATFTLAIYTTATVTGTAVQKTPWLAPIANDAAGVSGYIFYEHTPSTGSQSYCLGITCDTGTGSTNLTTTQLASLTVKVQ